MKPEDYEHFTAVRPVGGLQLDFGTVGKDLWHCSNTNDIELVKDGGWHFSFLKTPEDIKKKINSYSHQEFNTSNFTDVEKIEDKISKRKDLFERKINYKTVSIDNSFPEYIVKNKDKFKDWIL